MWLHPYDETVGPAIRGTIDLLYAKGSDRFRSLGENGGALGRMTARSIRARFRK